MTIDGTGDSVLALTRTVSGTASLTGRDGAISGINIEQLLKRLERRPLSGGGDFRTGSTPYDRIDVSLRMTQGTVEVQDMKVESTAVRLALAGSASIPERELDLKGTAALVSPTRAGAPPFGLPFVVQGSWDDPIMLPDAEALIRRSGAAAPLLNAVRERSTRDTVRSAIERLTGGSAAPAADTAAAPAKP
jgi:AsmA protein